MAKKLSKFTKKITHVDDLMIHNIVKYLVQTQLCLWDIKITNFKPERCPQDLLEICYFYISQTNSSLDKIFYKVVYHHIIYMCDFLGEFRRLFAVVYTDFHEGRGFHHIHSQDKNHYNTADYKNKWLDSFKIVLKNQFLGMVILR